MKFIYITLLFSFVFLKGQSQTWNEWTCTYDNDNPVFVFQDLLENKIEMIGGKKNAEKLFQQKTMFPMELKDTLCKILDSTFINIHIFISLDTLGKVENLKAWCNPYSFVSEFVKDMLIKNLPGFTPPIYKSRKVKTEIYYLFTLSTKKKIKKLKVSPPKFYIYPIFGNLQNNMK